MKIYLAGNTSRRLTDYAGKDNGFKTHKRLYSYWDLEIEKASNTVEHFDSSLQHGSIFIDSGAYSAFTRGKSIDLEKYCNWLRAYVKRVDCYSALDVIGDHVQTRKNTEAMKKVGLRPIVPFHFNSPISELVSILKDESYVALGGLVPLSSQKQTLVGWLDKCWAVIRKHWPKKIHCFGITSPMILTRYPFFSADSASALVGAGWGSIYSFSGGKLKSKNWRDAIVKDGQAVGSDVGSLGFMDRQVINANCFKKFETYLTDLWNARGIKFKES